MLKEEFLVLLSNHIWLYLLLALLSFILYFLLFKRYMYTIFDPILFYLVLEFSFWLSDIIFLNLLGYLKIYYLIHFVLSQLFFLLGYYVFKPFKYKINKLKAFQNSIPKNSNYIELIFVISISLYFINQLIVYKYLGIPLLMKSRWETFAKGGGLGIFSRIIQVTRFISVFLLFYYTMYFRNNIMKKFIYTVLWIVIIIFSLLSGSKMGILEIIYICFFAYIYFYKLGINTTNVEKKIKKLVLILLILSIVGALIIVDIGYAIIHNFDKQEIMSFNLDTLLYSLVGIVGRLVMNGYIYILSYPNDAMWNLERGNPFMNLFGGLLAFFRIIPYKDMPIEFGYRIELYHYPNIGYITGPTVHFDVFGLFNFGFFPSLLFAFLVGLLFSLVYNGFYYIKSKNFGYYIFFSAIAFYSLTLPLNVGVTLVYLLNVLIFVPIIFVISRIVSSGAMKSKFKAQNYELHGRFYNNLYEPMEKGGEKNI